MSTTRPIAASLSMGLVLLCIAGACRADDVDFSAVEHARRTIYHSPQTPGFTSWVGAWTMPDGSLMVSFTQATGPAEGRPQAPKEVQQKLAWPPPGHPGYDMTGLDLRNVHLRSTDAGMSWQLVSADPFQSCMNGVTGEAETALADGTIIRGVWGYYLPYNPELPKTGYLERSSDGSKSWSKPEVLLDPARYSAWPKRLRVLRDGRLIAVGGVAHVPANSRTRAEYSDLFEPLLMVSNNAGRTWMGPIAVVPPEHRKNWGGEEFDAAELPGGDLLCVFRRTDPDGSSREVRWQGVLKKSADTWIPGEVGPAPFPHSGHPDLLATREGPILHVATAGIHWTTDAGQTWHKLELPGTAYYPRAVQAADGRLFIFGHVGGDDAYGKVDQSIVMDSFRLVKREPKPESSQVEQGPGGARVDYPDHSDLSYYRDADGQLHPIRTVADWEVRRQHIIEGVQRVMGPRPNPVRAPLEVKTIDQTRAGTVVRRKITFQSDADDRVPAYILIPADQLAAKLPGVLCLHQTTPFGKDEPAGVRGDRDLKYALELAERGYVTIVPDYPTLGEHTYEFAAKKYASGSIKAISDNIRAIDVLETLPEVDIARVGVIGHSLGGHSGMFTALFEPRIKVIVSSCGFTTFRKDDLSSWTGPRYMPRIATEFGNDVNRVPFDFQELVAAFAPRPLLACAAEHDSDFDVSGVRDVMAAAAAVYKLYGVPDHLAAYYPPTQHAFPADARERAYEFLDRFLRP